MGIPKWLVLLLALQGCALSLAFSRLLTQQWCLACMCNSQPNLIRAMSFCMCVRRAISAFPTELWFYSYYYDKLEDAVVSGAAPILAALVVPLAILTWFLFQQCFIETELLSDEFSSQQLGQWSCSQISRFLCRVTQNFAHHFLKCALANSLYAKCKHPLLPCASPWLNIEYDVLPTTCGIPPHSLLTCPLVTIQQLGKNCA